MRIVLRILAILAVAALVVGVAVALRGSGAATDQSGPPLGQRGFGRQAQSEGARVGFQVRGPRPDGDPDEAGGLFGLATVLRNLVLISLIVLVCALVERGAKALRRRMRGQPRTLGPTPGA